MSGWADSPLSRTGREQVEQLARWLESEPPFAAVYSSPLQRAVETARALRGRTRGAIEIAEDFKEISCGAVDGLVIEDVKVRYPQVWAANLAQNDEEFRWPGGESYKEFRARCVAALRRIAAMHPGERVAIVTHAGVINQIVGWVLGISPAQWEPYRPANISLTELDWNGTSARLVAFNRRAPQAAPLQRTANQVSR